MVSTRQATSSTSPTSFRTARGARKLEAPLNRWPGIADSSSLPQPRAEGSPATANQATDSSLRKRIRNDPVNNDEAPLFTNLPPGEQNPGLKRAKIRAPAEGRRTRRQAQSTAQNVAIPMVQDTVADDEAHLSDTPLPKMTDRDGTLDNEIGLQGYETLPTDESARDPLHGLQLRKQSLPVLDNFATQILSVTASTAYQDLFSMATSPQRGRGQQWSQLITLFSETKKVYASDDPFLSSKKLAFIENGHMDIVRKANMATFVCGLFGGREDVGFTHLNDSFLDTFAMEGGNMLKSHVQLFLDLKTQAYISAVTNDKGAIIDGDRSREEILDALFSPQLNEQLVTRRAGSAQLTPVEREFVERAGNRREVLFEGSNSESAIDILPTKHPWEFFLKDVHDYITSNFDLISGNSTLQPARAFNPPKARTKTQAQTSFPPHENDQDQQLQNLISLQNGALQSAPSASDDIAEKAARAAHFAMENFDSVVQQNPAVGSPSQTLQDNQTLCQHQGQMNQAAGPPIQFHFERPLHPNVPSPPAPVFTQVPYQHSQMQGQWHPGSGADENFRQPYDAQGVIPYPTQSAPTHVLYERARQAASIKPSQQQSPRKTTTTTPTQRRPWTSEEENALMAGLDRVKGPHWSQIHAMFGPGGTINEVLKNRSQVQLKDKARNLKLFFLKSNIEVPYYLQFVTGELKTRAPARLAKNEAREKAMSEEDRAHVQGVMTLAGTANALQESDQNHLGFEDVQEERDHNGMGLSAAPLANDVNIDPSLEAQLQHAANPEAGFSRGYTVPTPNMIMQSLDKYSEEQGMGQQLQR